MRIFIIACLGLLSMSGCDLAPTDNSPTVKHFGGYAGLKFGMSFNEAMGQTQVGFFNPYSIKDCLTTLPIKGCFVSARDNLTTVISKDGVPYGLSLEFNKFDKLTDISLTFERETTEDPEQILKVEDCIEIHDRTTDWLASEFGKFTNIAERQGMPKTTRKGNPYYVSKANSENAFFAYASTNLPDRRQIKTLSYFLRIDADSTSCRIDVTFMEPNSIPRRTLDEMNQASPDKKEPTPKNQESPEKSRFPYVASDGVDITNQQDEKKNWEQYGTTQPNAEE